MKLKTTCVHDFIKDENLKNSNFKLEGLLGGGMLAAHCMIIKLTTSCASYNIPNFIVLVILLIKEVLSSFFFIS